jgi:WSC domain
MDDVLSNVSTSLSGLSYASADVPAIIDALQTQIAGDLIVSVKRSIYNPTFPAPGPQNTITFAPIPIIPVGNYSYQGCVTNFDTLTLAGTQNTNWANITNQVCINWCSTLNYTMAGTQSGSQCFCGNSLGASALLDSSGCTTPCNGDTTQACGGDSTISLYSSNTVSPGSFVTPSDFGVAWEAVGCVDEGLNGTRTLTGPRHASLGMTQYLCMKYCDSFGFPVAGVEYARECYCGSAFLNGGGGLATGCNMPCEGNSTQICGGALALNVFQRADNPDPVTTLYSRFRGAQCLFRSARDYNYRRAWKRNQIDWNAPNVIWPNATDVYNSPCDLLSYYPYFVWQMHEDLRIKLNDRVTQDWPARIVSLSSATSGDIPEIETAISAALPVFVGIDSTPEGWLQDIVSTIQALS